MNWWKHLLLPFFLFLGLATISYGEKLGDYANKIVVIPIEENSLSSPQGFGFINRTLKRASEENASAVVFDLNTPGGLAWETSDLMMKSLYRLDIPSFAYVNPRAMSAGALLAVSCDAIYMSPVSSIGAVGLVSSNGEQLDPMVREKAESAFTAFTRAVVKKKNHNVELVQAMMLPAEKDMMFGNIKLSKGKILTLTGEEATSLGPDGKPLLAKGIVNNIQELLDKEGNISGSIVIAKPTAFESFALWIARLSPLLILVGIGLIYLEMHTPGWGLAGTLAVVVFTLFFFGNNIAGNLAGYETIAMFIVGAILLIIELFVLPGTFIIGFAGTVLIVLALFSGMISSFDFERFMADGWSLSGFFELAYRPFLNLTIGLTGGFILVMIMIKYMPALPFLRSVANQSISGGSESGGAIGTTCHSINVGDIGISITQLCPNGKIDVHGIIAEARVQHGILRIGTPVRVIDKQAFNLIVEEHHSPQSSITATEVKESK